MFKNFRENYKNKIYKTILEAEKYTDRLKLAEKDSVYYEVIDMKIAQLNFKSILMTTLGEKLGIIDKEKASNEVR